MQNITMDMHPYLYNVSLADLQSHTGKARSVLVAFMVVELSISGVPNLPIAGRMRLLDSKLVTLCVLNNLPVHFHYLQTWIADDLTQFIFLLKTKILQAFPDVCLHLPN